MHDLLATWKLRGFLLLEPLEARYCFSAATAESVVLIDRTLLGRSRVWVGAGSEQHMAGLQPAELVRLTRARPMDAVQERA